MTSLLFWVSRSTASRAPSASSPPDSGNCVSPSTSSLIAARVRAVPWNQFWATARGYLSSAARPWGSSTSATHSSATTATACEPCGPACEKSCGGFAACSRSSTQTSVQTGTTPSTRATRLRTVQVSATSARLPARPVLTDAIRSAGGFSSTRQLLHARTRSLPHLPLFATPPSLRSCLTRSCRTSLGLSPPASPSSPPPNSCRATGKWRPRASGNTRRTSCGQRGARWPGAQSTRCAPMPLSVSAS